MQCDVLTHFHGSQLLGSEIDSFQIGKIMYLLLNGINIPVRDLLLMKFCSSTLILTCILVNLNLKRAFADCLLLTETYDSKHHGYEQFYFGQQPLKPNNAPYHLLPSTHARYSDFRRKTLRKRCCHCQNIGQQNKWSIRSLTGYIAGRILNV